jgi:GNAT superfamily N-acetyltransferase
MLWRAGDKNATGTAQERARALVATSSHPIGLIAYDGGRPIGWVAVSPRGEYPRLNAGRDTAPLCGVEGVWAIPCFFIVESHRDSGLARRLLDAAVQTAADAGAVAVEGVPGDPATKPRTPSASYTGSINLFAAAGFHEVARRTTKGRVLMRRTLA